MIKDPGPQKDMRTVDPRLKQYFYDEIEHQGILTDTLSPEEQQIIIEKFDELVRLRNLHITRVKELSDIVQNSDIKNLMHLEQYHGRYTKQTSTELIAKADKKIQKWIERNTAVES